MDSNRTYKTFVLVIGSLFLLMGCPRPAPLVLHPFPTQLSKEEVVTLLKAQAQSVSSIKSGFKARITYPWQGKIKSHSFEGAFLYRKDAKELRLQSLGTFGNTLFDVLYTPDKATVYLPASEIAYQGDPRRLIQSTGPDLFSFFQEMLNSMDGGYDGEIVTFIDNVVQIKTNDRSSTFTLNKNSLLVEQKKVAKRGEVIAEILYQNYKKFNESIFPAKITACFPSRKTTITFTLDSLVLNEPLTDKFFTLPLPSGTMRLPLSQLNDFFAS